MRAHSAIPSRPPPSQSEWMLLAGSSLTVIAILCIVTYLLIRERGSAELVAVRSATNIVQLIDADVEHNVELYDISLRGLIEATRLKDLAGIPADVRHRVLFDRATTMPHKGDILLLDNKGDVVADSASVIPRKDNFADREYFQMHVDNPAPQMMISRPFRSRSAEQDWRISFSRRLSSEQGEFLGVAEAAMRLDYFNALFKTLSVGRNGSVNLISSDGFLLAQQPPLGDDLIGRDFSNRPNFLRILKEGNGSFSSVSSVDHKARLYTFSQVGQLPLIVIVALSTDEVFAAWRRTALVVSLATGILCIGLLWLTWLLRRELRLRQRAEQELEQLAATDGLTGLANRRAMDQTLAREYSRAQRSGNNLSLLMIDVDHFKAFNDRHGHQLGDFALRAVADVIGGSVRRPADLAARYGGEEFAVILPETTMAGACALAEQIRASIEQLAPVGQNITPLTVSIGVGTWSAGQDTSPENLLRNADKALYQAKSHGRNRVVADLAASSPTSAAARFSMPD